MKATFTINGKEVEFKKVSVIITEDGEKKELTGLLLHDTDDTFHNGDAITTEYSELPESEQEAQDCITNAHWESDFTEENGKYIFNTEF